ncbi:hypothetical protein GCM10010404_88210 [Nonomuraea africana]|uniref:Transposase IS110-like N-terminal domain-containing protein n=1 Tax=Nonomuraea africana TaxID=46171 RepID=A0ABR9KJM2_9ACTN|nr:hypothetical protein [Nonomuraea africana]
MTMLAQTVDAVIGVDTHRDTHSACLVNPVGGELSAITITADANGYRQLAQWANDHAPGPRIVWAIEDTRSHGAGLVRALRQAGQHVIESDRPKRITRRVGGKSDALDARRAAREALGREHSAVPRADGPREAVRMLLVTRESAIHARTGAVNQLKALVLTAPEQQRQRLRGLTRTALIDACLALRPSATTDPEERTRRLVMQRLARRIRDLTSEIHAADDELAALVQVSMASSGLPRGCRGGRRGTAAPTGRRCRVPHRCSRGHRRSPHAWGYPVTTTRAGPGYRLRPGPPASPDGSAPRAAAAAASLGG